MNGDSSGADARERAVGLTDLFLEKPFTLPQVTAMVDTLLDG
jgi:hypothetical protein